ncbi:hypothetical protein SLH46_20365 [Draconibacterium sp. IB214405]|uniref:hypothetical protein n=1 Tax=Draconibacterium sp. IB214405 TaxID=3097352 RepID=UPI002A105A7F|nr:hypothetical protein [Draconibacterium sp. IB214405]MDX8341564.1 hypothetical protein [Draconibacterium sp. IB214405]
MSISKSDIEKFLSEFGMLLRKFDVFYLENGQVNVQKLLDLDITIKERREIIESLHTNDYVNGTIDEAPYGDDKVWIFSKKLNEIMVKIKITICKTEREIYISFN